MPLTTLKNAIVQNTQTRHFALSALQIYASTQFWRNGPHIFVNSFPKAGTHLMTAELVKIEGIMNSYLHLEPRFYNLRGEYGKRSLDVRLDVSKLTKRLRRIRPGQFVTAHFGFNSDFNSTLNELNFKTIFVVRDPRDVVVSELNYAMTLKRHFLRSTLLKSYATERERLDALIDGIDIPPYQRALGKRWRQYIEWADAPGVLTVRFEDLVGSRGGGDDAVKRATMDRVARHLGLASSDGVDSERLYATTWTPTLRKGKIGTWRDVLTTEQVERIRRDAGDVLDRLGYAD